MQEKPERLQRAGTESDPTNTRPQPRVCHSRTEPDAPRLVCLLQTCSCPAISYTRMVYSVSPRLVLRKQEKGRVPATSTKTTCAGATLSSQWPVSSLWKRPTRLRDTTDEETTDWIAVCRKIARTVRRAGTTCAVPDPYYIRRANMLMNAIARLLIESNIILQFNNLNFLQPITAPAVLAEPYLACGSYVFRKHDVYPGAFEAGGAATGGGP